MEIEKYTGLFHDGTIKDIISINDVIEILMESSEINEDFDLKDFILSKYNTIIGKLIIKNINKILVNNKFQDKLKMRTNDGEILRFKITDNKIIELLIKWIEFTNKQSEIDHIIIEADKIHWENKLDFFDYRIVL